MPIPTRSQTLTEQLAKQFNTEFGALLAKDKQIQEGDSDDSTEKLQNLFQLFLCFNKYMPLIYKLKPSYVRLTRTAQEKTIELMQELQIDGHKFHINQVTALNKIMKQTIQLCERIITTSEPM